MIFYDHVECPRTASCQIAVPACSQIICAKEHNMKLQLWFCRVLTNLRCVRQKFNIILNLQVAKASRT